MGATNLMNRSSGWPSGAIIQFSQTQIGTLPRTSPSHKHWEILIQLTSKMTWNFGFTPKMFWRILMFLWFPSLTLLTTSQLLSLLRHLWILPIWRPYLTATQTKTFQHSLRDSTSRMKPKLMQWWAISSRCLTTRSSSQITKEPIRNMHSPNLSLKLWMTHTIRSSPTLHSNWHQDMWAPSWLLRIINAYTMSAKLSQTKPRLATFAETSPSAAWTTLSFSLAHSILETSNRSKNLWLLLGWIILRWGYCWMSQYLHLLDLS